MASGKIMSLKAALLAALAGAAGSGLLVADAAAKVSRRDDEAEVAPPLLLAPPQVDASELLAHRSHSSHRSHRSHSSGGHGSHGSHASHYSGSTYSGGSSSSKSYSGGSSSSKSYSSGSSSSKSHSGSSSRPTLKSATQVPLKPAKVSFVALPGGSIFVDGKLVGRDETPRLKLKAGVHLVKVENRFLGTHETVIMVGEGQSGKVKLEW